MANLNNDNASKIQLASLTLILLVKYFRTQMISLLVRNGVFVTEKTTNEQIISLMTTLLKVSKSFNTDLNNFLQNPKVLDILARDMQGNAQFYKTSGNAQYFRVSGKEEDDDMDKYLEDLDNKYFEEGEKEEEKEKSGTSWWDSIKGNLGNYIGDGIKLVGALDTNRTNRDIANARAKIAQAESEGQTFTPKEKQDILDGKGKGKDDTGVSVTTIVVLSLVGVVTLGTIIFFATRNKN